MEPNNNSLPSILEGIRSTQAYAVDKLHLDFTENLLDRMEQLGVNQSELAERIGCSRSYISKAFNQPRNFTLETVAKMAFALNLEATIQLAAKEPVAIPARSFGEQTISTTAAGVSSPSFSTGYSTVKIREEINDHDEFAFAA